MGIDPGTKTGVSILIVNTANFNIIDIKTYLFNGSTYVTLDTRLQALYTFIQEIYKYYSPVACGIEAAFINHSFPAAGLYLAHVISCTKLAIYNLNNPLTKIYTYSPKFIKMSSGAGGKANKDDMLKATIGLDIDTTNITDHEIDALHISITTLKEIKLNVHRLFIP